MRQKLLGFTKNVLFNYQLMISAILLIIGILIVVPKTQINIGDLRTSIDGLDLPEVTNNVVTSEFKFSPSQDFYGGVEYRYDIVDGSDPVIAASKLKNLLLASGVTDPIVYAADPVSINTEDEVVDQIDEQTDENASAILDNANFELGNPQVVARIPGSQEDLSTFNQLLFLTGDISLVKEVIDTNTNEEDILTNPQYVPAEIGLDDVQSIGAIYGADYGGDGIVLDFRPELANQLAISVTSDINPSAEDTIYLSFSGQIIAQQRFHYSTQQGNARLYLFSYLGNDRIAANAVRYLIQNKDEAVQLVLSTQDEYPGHFDSAIPAIQITTVAAIALFAGFELLRKRKKGISNIYIVGFMFVLPMAFAKIFNLPASISTFSGIIVGIIIWYLLFNKLEITEITKPTKSKFEEKMTQIYAESWNLFTITFAVTILGFLIRVMPIGAVSEVLNATVLTLFIGFLSFYTAIAGVIKLSR